MKLNNIALAIATSADISNVNFVMESTNIRKYFEAIIDAGCVSEGKPSPEIYLKAAKGINKKPKECIVIEDSVSGIKSAINAGMKVIAITSTHISDELTDADLIIDSFNELSIPVLRQLISV